MSCLKQQFAERCIEYGRDLIAWYIVWNLLDLSDVIRLVTYYVIRGLLATTIQIILLNDLNYHWGIILMNWSDNISNNVKITYRKLKAMHSWSEKIEEQFLWHSRIRKTKNLFENYIQLSKINLLKWAYKITHKVLCLWVYYKLSKVL